MKSRLNRLAIVFCALTFFGIDSSKAENCETLASNVHVKLSNYLTKQLHVELKYKSKTIIAEWHEDYGNKDLLDTLLSDTKDRLPGSEQAADQAKIEYQQAKDDHTHQCADG